MTDQQNDFSLNDPSRGHKGIKADTQKGRSGPEEQVSSTGHRDGEITYGVPEPANVAFRPMAEHEKSRYKKEDLEADKKRLERLSSQVIKDLNGFQLPSWLKQTCIWGLTALAAVLILLLIGQVTTFLAQFNELHLWSQWVVGSLLSVIAIVIVFLVFKIFMLSLKLKKNDQINFKVIEALSEREALRELAHGKRLEAVDKLKKNLKDFPITKEDTFIELGMDRNSFHELTQTRKKLLNPSEELSPDKWLDLYRTGFQVALDETAVSLYKSYAKKTALKTAISPLPMLDTAIVLTLSLSMVRDMMTLYNLKVGAVSAGYILVHAISQAYIAGELQDLSDSFAESLNDVVAGHVGQVASKITTVIGAKAGEGVANGLMMYRLGRSTTKLLQPTC